MDNVDRDWNYRISVYYVSDEDSNTYVCKTPRGKLNAVSFLVTGKLFQILCLIPFKKMVFLLIIV